MIKIIIDDIPPSNNKYIGRSARWEYREEKQRWEALVKVACIGKPKQQIKKAVVHIHYCFKDRIRRDPDNYSGKMILDGLVKAGVIKDDNFACIELVLSAEMSSKRPRTEVTVSKIS